MAMPIDTCWHMVHLAFNFQLTTCSKLTLACYSYLYLHVISYNLNVNLTSTRVLFRLNICQCTFTLSSMVSDGYLSLDFHQDDFIEAALVCNNWVLCYLTTYALIS